MSCTVDELIAELNPSWDLARLKFMIDRALRIIMATYYGTIRPLVWFFVSSDSDHHYTTIVH